MTFQRVTSQANLSDKVSRGDFSEAEQLQCETWEPAFDRAWPDLLRLQQAPESTSSWDYQAVIDSLSRSHRTPKVGKARGEWFV